MDEDMYKSRGGQIPIRWTSIEVRGKGYFWASYDVQSVQYVCVI